MLYVVCGLPGVGKTTVSRHLADREGYDLLRSDVVRADVVEDPSYTEAEIRRVYDELFARARERLERDGGAVLDATFGREDYRERAATVAGDCGVDVRFVMVECDPAVVRERIAAREDDASDADFSVYREHRDAFEPLSRPHAVVDNSGGREATREQVDELV
ncbi:AAA family ATPase [Haloglomus litoreum]|uniref:AAA family ATPase n=1 Tax=Haloglomus litoreum TaxID=3034026 RepID=UPI0023E7ED1C|nr:AAA family ATPase [Haloglomus sp. DT116]